MGSAAHQALIERIVRCYEADPRVRAVAVFGSVAAGTWHDLSDVDLDIVVTDDAAIDPAAEARAIFGASAAIVITRGDSADVVLGSLAEPSIRWHALTALRGRRDGLRLDPADPLGALAAVVEQATESFDLGPGRRALLERMGLGQSPTHRSE
jgi:predicted nucleotidyltransferase